MFSNGFFSLKVVAKLVQLARAKLNIIQSQIDGIVFSSGKRSKIRQRWLKPPFFINKLLSKTFLNHTKLMYYKVMKLRLGKIWQKFGIVKSFQEK